MLRSLYFTWDQLTGPYLNAHSLLGCSTGALGNLKGEVGRDFSYGRFWLKLGGHWGMIFLSKQSRSLIKLILIGAFHQ